MKIGIRKAIPTDSEALAALCITVWVDTYCFEGIEASHARYILDEYTPENLNKRMTTTSVYIAEIDCRMIGLGIVNDKTGEIETLYVLPRLKGLRAGSLLVAKLREQCSSLLFLTCWEGNESARRFYRKLGFVETGEVFLNWMASKLETWFSRVHSKAEVLIAPV